MSFPSRLLGEGEEVVFEVHPHWSFLGWPLISLVASAAVTIAVAVGYPKAPIALMYVFFAALGSSFLWVSGRWTRRVTTTVALTSARVVKRSGVLSRSNLEIRLERINELSFHQSIWNRILRTGEVLVEVGGETGVVVLDHIAQPALVQSVISEQVSKWHRAGQTQLARVEFPSMQTPPAGTPKARSGADPPSAAERLVQLDELRRRGIVSAEEYEEKKRELLRDL